MILIIHFCILDFRMKKFNYAIASIITVIVITLSTIFIFSDKKEFSENEFRYLEKFPKFSWERLTSGTFMKEMESYTTDHFPFRDTFVSFRTLVKEMTLNTLVNDVYIAKDGYLINRFTKPRYMDEIIDNVNEFRHSLEDVDMDFMLVPTSTSINADLLPPFNINEKEEDVIYYYCQNLDMDCIDVQEDLIKEKEHYQLYYKTDHHWTSFGAYVAYRKFCQDNNLSYYELEDMDIQLVSDSFLGTLYSKVFPIKKEADKIYRINLKNTSHTLRYLDKVSTSLYVDSYLEGKDKYSYFLGSNEPLIVIENNNLPQGEDILVIKDSYANALIPLLVNNYKVVHVIDPRYYGLGISDYIRENNLSKVLFVYNVNSIDNDAGILTIK